MGAITILTQWQSAVRNAEGDLLNLVYGQLDASSFKFNKLIPIVLPQRDQEYYRNIFYLNNFPVSDLSRYNVTIQGFSSVDVTSTIDSQVSNDLDGSIP